MMTTHAQPLWMAMRLASRKSGPACGGRGLRPGVGLGGHVDQLGDLVLGEAGHLAEAASEVDRVLLGLSAEAAEAEQLVDGALELERLLLPLLVVRGDA